MAKICPLNLCSSNSLCHSDCAWRIKDECAIKVIADNAMVDNIRKGVIRKFINMRYGTLVPTYQDTDGFGIQQTIYNEINKEEE